MPLNLSKLLIALAAMSGNDTVHGEALARNADTHAVDTVSSAVGINSKSISELYGEICEIRAKMQVTECRPTIAKEWLVYTDQAIEHFDAGLLSRAARSIERAHESANWRSASSDIFLLIGGMRTVIHFARSEYYQSHQAIEYLVRRAGGIEGSKYPSDILESALFTTSMTTGHFELARSVAEKLMKAQAIDGEASIPRKFEAIGNLAKAYLAIGDLNKASDCCTQIGELMSANQSVLTLHDRALHHYLLGTLEIRRLDFAEGVRQLNLARDAISQSTDRRSNLEIEIALSLCEAELRADNVEAGNAHIKDAFTLLDERVAKRDPIRVFALCIAADLAERRSRDDKAAEWLAEARAMSIHPVGHPHPYRAKTMLRSALHFHKVSEWERIEGALAQALISARETGAQLETAVALTMQARLKVKFYNFRHAANLIDASDEILESKLSPEHPMFLENRFLSSICAYENGQYDEAAKKLSRLQAEHVRQFGPSSIRETEITAYLGACYEKTGEHGKADKYLTFSSSQHACFHALAASRW